MSSLPFNVQFCHVKCFTCPFYFSPFSSHLIDVLLIVFSLSLCSRSFIGGGQQLHVQEPMQHDPLQQRALHGQDPQQDVSALPGEEVQQIGEVHHVSAHSH